MLKLRLLPILIAVLGSSAILFGGWFAYRSIAMENPMSRLLTGVPGVEKSEASIGSQKAVFTLKLNEQANLREIIQKINRDGASVIGKRELDVQVDSNTSPRLEEWWSRALFDVAQAMETKQYAKIPATLEEKAGEIPGLQVVTEMDENNVYVRLTDEEHSKYVILPRNPGKLGVWPHE